MSMKWSANRQETTEMLKKVALEPVRKNLESKRKCSYESTWNRALRNSIRSFLHQATFCEVRTVFLNYLKRQEDDFLTL